MITVPTTFVLGAGASQPYGLPLGPQLLVRARRIRSTPELWNPLVGNSRILTEQLVAFETDVKKYPGKSIDMFLRHFPKHRDIGRRVIAALMATAIENPHPSRIDADGDWIAHLANFMAHGVGKAEDLWRLNDVKFVTFNFDSVLEERLTAQLCLTYGASVSAPAVVHVHGRLPERTPVPFEEWLNGASQSVRVIEDEIISNDVREAARTAIEDREVVCFLGCSYDPVNLETLDVVTRLRKAAAVYGSAFLLDEQDRQNTRLQFECSITLGSDGAGCLAFLKQNHVLRFGRRPA